MRRRTNSGCPVQVRIGYVESVTGYRHIMYTKLFKFLEKKRWVVQSIVG